MPVVWGTLLLHFRAQICVVFVISVVSVTHPALKPLVSGFVSHLHCSHVYRRFRESHRVAKLRFGKPQVQKLLNIQGWDRSSSCLRK